MSLSKFYKLGILLAVVCVVAVVAIVMSKTNSDKTKTTKAIGRESVKHTIALNQAASSKCKLDVISEKITKAKMPVVKVITVENDDKIKLQPNSVKMVSVKNNDKTESLPISSNIVYSKPASNSVMPEEIQSWRNIREDLDNIYTKPDVSGIRDNFIKKYLDSSKRANQQQDWTRRNIYRVTANSQLKKAVKHLEELYKTTTDSAIKEECMVAISELSYKASDYDNAIVWAKKAIDEVSDRNLQAHAYHYVRKSFVGLGDTTNSKKFLDLFFQNLPDEARNMYGGGDIVGRERYQFNALIRGLVFGYKMAEKFDGMAIQFPQEAAEMRKKRDLQIARAQEYFSSATVPLLDALEEN